MSKSFIEHSKSHFTVENPNLDNINTGCLQRIANATELMATNFLRLQESNEYLKNRNRHLLDEVERLKRSASAYKGKYNRLKNKSDHEK